MEIPLDTAPIPMLDFKIEYAFLREAIDAAIKRCLEHQTWILGPEVSEFERACEAFLSVPHCVGVSSGTEALILALRAFAHIRLNQEYFTGQEVVTTPFTFTATGDAILRAHATPVFVDIDPATFNLDTSLAAEYLDSTSSVVGVLPVHLYGRPCDLDPLQGAKRREEIFILEDVAQAFGATLGDHHVGTIGDAGTFSYFPSKNLGGFGDAGMVSTKDPRIADVVRMLLKHGGKDKYNVEYLGYNARLDTIQAAILLAKLPFVAEFNRRRAEIATIYTQELSRLSGLVIPTLPANGTHVFHQYTLRVLENRRRELQEHLAADNIASMVYYPVPLHHMKLFTNRAKIIGSLIHAETAAREVLSLPIEPLQSEATTERVIRRIHSYFAK
jgi:dTDP-4-amino-4,6-dideoxygalactose transaminase